MYKGITTAPRRWWPSRPADLEEAEDETQSIQQEITVPSQCDSPHITRATRHRKVPQTGRLPARGRCWDPCGQSGDGPAGPVCSGGLAGSLPGHLPRRGSPREALWTGPPGDAPRPGPGARLALRAAWGWQGEQGAAALEWSACAPPGAGAPGAGAFPGAGLPGSAHPQCLRRGVVRGARTGGHRCSRGHLG